MITLYKIDGMHFRLLGTNGFHVKAKTERFTFASWCCRQNLKYENLTSSFARPIKTLHQKACRTCSTIIFRHSTNQIIDLWHWSWRCCRQILTSLLSPLGMRRIHETVNPSALRRIILFIHIFVYFSNTCYCELLDSEMCHENSGHLHVC